MSRKEDLYDLLVTPDMPFSLRMVMLGAAVSNPDLTPEQLVEAAQFIEARNVSLTGLSGVYGNVWVHGHIYKKAGDQMETHTHHHHHQSLIGHGSVMAYIEGQEPQVYHAGQFIPVHKGLEHSFVALEDGTTQFCVWAIRDENGEIPEFIDGVPLPFDPNADPAELRRLAWGSDAPRERQFVVKKLKV